MEGRYLRLLQQRMAIMLLLVRLLPRSVLGEPDRPQDTVCAIPRFIHLVFGDPTHIHCLGEHFQLAVDDIPLFDGLLGGHIAATAFSQDFRYSSERRLRGIPHRVLLLLL